MVQPKRICVVTGSRAEYGLLYWVIHDIRQDPELTLQLVVTGMHLEPRFGMTVERIKADGFLVDRRVAIDLSDDSPGGVARSMSRGLAGMSDAIEALQPDVLLVLGDRFEIMVAAQAAMVHNIPIAHIAGGDTTEGAFDEAIRHSITKMAHVHLTTNADSARRVARMGENPAHIHVVGSPGLDHLQRAPLMSAAELEASLEARLGERNVLVTFHPVTLEAGHGVDQFEALLRALDALPRKVVKWVTRPNADPGNQIISDTLDRWAEAREDVHVYTSLGQARYLALMSQVDAVIGNSSSGLYEAPSFQVPTVDIGDRQGGRLAAPSVIHAEPTAQAISAAIDQALALDCSDVVNPYGDGRAAGRIVAILKALPARDALLHKTFHQEAVHA
ncbi:MAG: UDP-N-acetylglucosamine 2-epimerase [Gemmatimonadales bacterium]|nr:UDP-N-acetylglucosamine 2-epimerase [Gemmatimonadales bacterium]